MPVDQNKENENLSTGRALGLKGFELKLGVMPNLSPAATTASALGQAQQTTSSNALQPKPQPKSSCGSCAAAGKTGPCDGHGGGGPGGDNPDNSHESANIDSSASANDVNEKLDLERLTKDFEFTVNLENGSLNIAPKPGANLTPEEIEAYFAKLDQHFDAFQKQFPDAEGFSRELVGNVMTYTIPAEHYGAFIESLVKSGLAPASVLQQLNNLNAQQVAVLPLFQEGKALQTAALPLAPEGTAPQTATLPEKGPSPLLANSFFAHKSSDAFKPPVPTFGSGAKAADEEKQQAGFSFGRSPAAAA